MPDAFGNPTPQEVMAAIQERASAGFHRAQRSGSPGLQAGASLAAIFGKPIARALDTRTARREERDRLMEIEGLSKEDAIAQARATVSPQLRQVRRAEKIQSLSSESSAQMQDNLALGMDPDRARYAAVLNMSRRLRDAGMVPEADRLTMQAAELRANFEQKERENRNLEARTRASTASAASSEANLEFDDDTFVKFNMENGSIERMISVPVTNPQMAQNLRDAGYINVGNQSFGVQLDQDVLAGMRAPPATVQEAVIGGLNMMASIKILRGIRDQVGFDGPIPEGAIRNVAAQLGITAFDNEDFVTAVAVRKQMRADIQSIIDGIPSNYDASVFEATIPDPGAFRGVAHYDAQLDNLERKTRGLLELSIAFYKGTNQAFPEPVLQAARALGIDVPSVQALTAQELRRDEDGYIPVFRAHEQSVRLEAAAANELAVGAGSIGANQEALDNANAIIDQRMRDANQQ